MKFQTISHFSVKPILATILSLHESFETNRNIMIILWHY